MFPIKDTIHSRSFPFVNWLLIIANVAVFVLWQVPLGPQGLPAFVNKYGLVPALLVRGQAWSVVTVFTSMFLHGGWLHLISNMWALFIFGDNVEDRLGPGRYIGFYLLSGVAAALTQVWADPASRLPLVGASGAIAGVLAAYLVLYPNARVITLFLIFFIPAFVEIPALIYLGIWFVSQLLNGLFVLDKTTMGGVAFWAHIGGFLFGLVLVRLFARRSRVYYRTYADEYRPW